MAELKERIIGFEIFGRSPPSIEYPSRGPRYRGEVRKRLSITTMTPPMMGMGDRASPRLLCPVFRAPELLSLRWTRPRITARDSVSTLQASRATAVADASAGGDGCRGSLALDCVAPFSAATAMDRFWAP